MLLDAGTPAPLPFPDSFPPLSTLFSCSPALSLQRKTTDMSLKNAPKSHFAPSPLCCFLLNMFFCRGIPAQSHSRSYFSSFLSFCDGGMSLQWNAALLASGVTEDGQSEASRGTRRGEEGEEKMEGPCVGIPSPWLIPPNRLLKESCKQLHGKATRQRVKPTSTRPPRHHQQLSYVCVPNKKKKKKKFMMSKHGEWKVQPWCWPVSVSPDVELAEQSVPVLFNLQAITLRTGRGLRRIMQVP